MGYTPCTTWVCLLLQQPIHLSPSVPVPIPPLPLAFGVFSSLLSLSLTCRPLQAGPDRKQTFRQQHFLQFLSSSPPGSSATHPEPCLRAQPPHFRSLRPGPSGGRSLGKAWLPFPSCPCPTSAGLHSRRESRAETGGGYPPGRCHMLLRPQRPLQVPAPAAVPSAVPSAGPAAPPAARPWPPDGREGSGSPRKFQSRICLYQEYENGLIQ
ncbi:uncharacterized protein LOC129041651 [Pongo pygmaeus]|uniref:uncharacterized protein LOC129041651 n=1 Tax=Pongo pygmaeus TaxID=9600 RepID=UPI0023E24F1E|nr:uncharacterized protein LOC129041651 [Pongo pygmaeus]